MLKICNLQLELHDQRLFEPLNFELSNGKCLQLCGPNGVGKTSILKILAGLLKARRGNILWQGKKLTSLSQEAKYLGHELALKMSLTTEENLQYYAKIMQAKNEDIKLAADFFGLAPLEKKQIQYLSSGQKHRVQLAKLLIAQRPIWMLDEPFTGLDQYYVQQLLTLFKVFLDNDGIIILTSHHPLQTEAFVVEQYHVRSAQDDAF